jgi:SpoVK/Ycf46/Vps4 family AAA+-type ATPase
MEEMAMKKLPGVDIVASSASTSSPSTFLQGGYEELLEQMSIASEEDAAESNMPVGERRMWSVTGDQYYPCDKSVRRLPPGQYIPTCNSHRGVFLVKTNAHADELMILPDSKSEYILAEIERFWRSKALFDRHGLLWKRGVILTGPPGSGKTSTLQQVSARVVSAGGISMYCTDPSVTAEALRVVRRIEPERPIVLLMEDIDAIISQHGDADLLALLDGELQVSNILHIATTNYPEQLDPRFIQRPSRFDDIVEIGMPSAEARDAYLKVKNPGLSDAERARWVAGTDGFSLAALKEVIVAVECLGRALEPTLERVRKMLDRKPTSEDSKKSSIGFTS